MASLMAAISPSFGRKFAIVWAQIFAPKLIYADPKRRKAAAAREMMRAGLVRVLSWPSGVLALLSRDAHKRPEGKQWDTFSLATNLPPKANVFLSRPRASPHLRVGASHCNLLGAPTCSMEMTTIGGPRPMPPCSRQPLGRAYDNQPTRRSATKTGPSMRPTSTPHWLSEEPSSEHFLHGAAPTCQPWAHSLTLHFARYTCNQAHDVEH